MENLSSERIRGQLTPGEIQSGLTQRQDDNDLECKSCCIKIPMMKTRHDPVIYHKIMSPGCDFIRSVNEIKKPQAYPQYQDFMTRASTFARSNGFFISIFDMSDAGFFHTGTSDKVTCYYCGGSMEGWKPEDCPWINHAYLFADCEHVRMIKGDEFINSVQTFGIDADHSQYDPDITSYSVWPKCQACLVEEVQTIFKPCNHPVSCEGCSNITNCLECNHAIENVVKILKV